jgi:hypothetical protein
MASRAASPLAVRTANVDGELMRVQRVQTGGALATGPLLRLAASWALRAVGAERVAVRVTLAGHGRPDLVHAGSRPPLSSAVLDGVARAVGRSGRVLLASRAAARVRQPARRTGAQDTVGVPVRGRHVAGCIVARRSAGFAAADAAVLAEVAACMARALDEVADGSYAAEGAFHRLLHDGLGQTLTSLLFAIRDVEGEQRSVALRMRLRAVRAQAARGVQEVRALLECIGASPAWPPAARRRSRVLRARAHTPNDPRFAR